MSRFSEPQDPAFQALNASLSFDKRLWPHDIAQSRAHATMLAAQGIIADAERDALLDGLAAVEKELTNGVFGFRDDDEDIHMAVERRLTEIVGAVGGKLHTARSRNDQVATDVSLFCRETAGALEAAVAALMTTLVSVAESHLDWPMPGYTHLQRAQPVYLSHHLLAYVWMLDRDRARLRFARDQTAKLPLGAGALAGVNFDTDRRSVADALGFADVAPNSIDAVSNRDFVLDLLNACATCSTHLSRLGAELVLWSSEEFGFVTLSDSWSSGSSIMPQKKNPDAAELLRGKAPRVVGHLAALHGVMHALPLTYNKDMQEDKEHLFDAVDTLALSLNAADGMLAGATFRADRLAEAASDELIAATDLADLLVKRGVPFRECHGIIAGLVRDAVDSQRRLSDFSVDELQAHSEHLDATVYEVLAKESWLESKVSEGGTSLARVREQLTAAKALLRVTAQALDAGFYARPVVDVARDLIGCVVRHQGTSGVIVETEAYHDSEPACHAYIGVTPRTEVLFGPPGHAYVYRSYGIHALLNAVCEPQGVGAAVLIRALQPLGGVEVMVGRRNGLGEPDLCSGPGKLTQALGIGLDLNSTSLLDGPVTIELRTGEWSDVPIMAGPRIGITKAVELPWRFSAAGNPFVSRPRPAGP